MNPGADIHLFGQEVNPETFAICKSDLFMKSADGRDAENVVFGSTLSNDRHAGAGFDYMIANPPYGKDWKRDQDAVRDEHDRGAAAASARACPASATASSCSCCTCWRTSRVGPRAARGSPSS